MSREGWSLVESGLSGVEREGGINWLTLPFDQLSGAVLYRVLALRSAVFIVEQECLRQEMDGLDLRSDVVVGIRSWGATGDRDAMRHDVVATARILPPGTAFSDPSIGRMCVASPWRQLGVGRILVQRAARACRQRHPGLPVRMSAQAHLQKFFQAIGFQAASSVYLEDQIPHIEMVLPPPKEGTALNG